MASKTKKLCLICDGECSIDWLKEEATLEQGQCVLIGFKLCTKHATETNDILVKRELEMQVA